jgi:hypothetical protein
MNNTSRHIIILSWETVFILILFLGGIMAHFQMDNIEHCMRGSVVETPNMDGCNHGDHQDEPPLSFKPDSSNAITSIQWPPVKSNNYTLLYSFCPQLPPPESAKTG